MQYWCPSQLNGISLTCTITFLQVSHIKRFVDIARVKDSYSLFFKFFNRTMTRFYLSFILFFMIPLKSVQLYVQLIT